jgi:FkbM family methyltransferase
MTGFEPDLEGCERLGRTYGPPHRFFPLFIGDGTAGRFHRTVATQTGSLFRPNQRLLERFNDLHELTEVVAVHDVNTARLDDALPGEDTDFLKIDVQGGELAVLQGAATLLQSAVMVQTEVEFVEIYEGQPLFADVDRHLRSQGFWFHAFVDQGARTLKPLRLGAPDRGIKQMLWADAVYIRPLLAFDTLADDKLLKLAILLHDLFASVDFAYACLRTVDTRRGSRLADDYGARLVNGGFVAGKNG